MIYNNSEQVDKDRRLDLAGNGLDLYNHPFHFCVKIFLFKNIKV